jgi:hypothetical protein
MSDLLFLFFEMIILLLLMSVAAELIVKGAEILEHKYGSAFVGAIIPFLN